MKFRGIPSIGRVVHGVLWTIWWVIWDGVVHWIDSLTGLRLSWMILGRSEVCAFNPIARKSDLLMASLSEAITSSGSVSSTRPSPVSSRR